MEQKVSDLIFLNAVEIYTDGACSGNPGPGGWAYIITWKGIEKGLSGRKLITTNNEMELTAFNEALKAVKIGTPIIVYTDSKYVCDSINKGWLERWVSTNGVLKRPNGALWKEVYSRLQNYDYQINLVKGHNGNYYNEMCDRMAVRERDLAASGVL